MAGPKSSGRQRLLLLGKWRRYLDLGIGRVLLPSRCHHHTPSLPFTGSYRLWIRAQQLMPAPSGVRTSSRRSLASRSSRTGTLVVTLLRIMATEQ